MNPETNDASRMPETLLADFFNILLDLLEAFLPGLHDHEPLISGHSQEFQLVCHLDLCPNYSQCMSQLPGSLTSLLRSAAATSRGNLLYC